VLAAVEVDSHLPAVDSRTNHKLESIEITPDKVENKLKDLKISKSPGPDNFHPRVLRELISVLSALSSISVHLSSTCTSCKTRMATYKSKLFFTKQFILFHVVDYVFPHYRFKDFTYTCQADREPTINL
jgi:hypothetical protein